ncbi:MAG: CBS domain-containing protein [Bacteroidales bacterium]|nr:CBS domain-containing protein [Bacteroidales bacterium]
MLAIELISEYIVPLKTSDTALTALSLMEEFKVKHLPIVNDKVLLALISEEDIYTYNQFEEPVGAHPIVKPQISIYDTQHIYDVMTAFYEDNLSLLPVINTKNHYLGSIHSWKLVSSLAEITGVINPGGIIVLEMNVNDYSLSQIAQIIESNNSKLINLYIRTNKDSTLMEVTIKLNTMDLDPVLQTFYRYNYLVRAYYTEEMLESKLLDNYDSLMNYLNL